MLRSVSKTGVGRLYLSSKDRGTITKGKMDMSRPSKLASATRHYNFIMRQKQYEMLTRKAEELTKLTQKQVSVADIIRLCVDMHMTDTCDEIERRYRAQRY